MYDKYLRIYFNWDSKLRCYDITDCYKSPLYNMVHTALMPAKISNKDFNIWMQMDIILVQKNI